MIYRIFIVLILSFFLIGCQQTLNNSKKIQFVPSNKYTNSGFALIYNNNLTELKKLDDRSLNIYHKSLKKKSIVKIINPANGKYLIAEVKSNKMKFSNFYNSVLSLRIAEELELNSDEPFINLILLPKLFGFVKNKSSKSKMIHKNNFVSIKT